MDKNFKITKGLDLPIAGRSARVIEDKSVSRVAVLGTDFVGLRPRLAVEVGHKVKCGQTIWVDERRPGICFTAPAGGVIEDIHRDERRALLSVVIKVDAQESMVPFARHDTSKLGSLKPDRVREQLLCSGQWVAFRTRPYNKIPAADSTPQAIFINAMDTRPLAADPQVIIDLYPDAFEDGLRVLAHFGVPMYLCTTPKAAGDYAAIAAELEHLNIATFTGPHPAGLSGTHIHYLAPVDANKTVWHIQYQDVIATGKLFTTGELFSERVISLAGPQVQRPRLIRTRLGAATADLVRDELKPGENRIVSGSVLHGHHAVNALAFLGRYDLQASVIEEGRDQQTLSWLRPGAEKYSLLNLFVSCLTPRKQFAMTSTTGGEARAMVPVGSYEQIMPLDILPTPLLRALIVDDSETALALGCLELDEEDLSLCTYVCPGKYDYGPLLRRCLDRIEKEGV